MNYERKYEAKLKKMDNLVRMWKQRNLSLKGKITVINSLIISLFVYPMSILVTPEKVLKEIEQCVTNFLWDGKTAKISRYVLQNKIIEGGLKLPNIFDKERAWKLWWLKRAIKDQEKPWQKIIISHLNNITFLDLLNIHNPPEKLLDKLPDFYKIIIQNWDKIHWRDISCPEGILNESVWHNKCITIENQPFFWDNWYLKGIKKIKDLVDRNGRFLSHEEIKI